jgi:hypothetical protein
MTNASAGTQEQTRILFLFMPFIKITHENYIFTNHSSFYMTLGYEVLIQDQNSVFYWWTHCIPERM